MRRAVVFGVVVVWLGIVLGAGVSKSSPRVFVRRHTPRPTLNVPKSTSTWVLNENFDSDTLLPSGWTTIDGDGDGYPWFVYVYNPHSEPHSAGSIYNASGNDDWLITPSVSINSGDVLSFWFAAQDPSWCNEHLQVLISTTGSDTADFEDVILDTVLADTSWHNFTYDLSAYAGEDIYVAFRNIAVDMFIIKVDDVQIGTRPACDAQISAIDTVDPYIDPGEEFVPMATVTSLGSEPLDADVYCYVIHGDDTVNVDTVTVSGIGYGESEIVSFPGVTLDISDAVYEIAFEVYAPADSNLEDNYSAMYVYTYTTPRTVLFQEFTATWCTWCPYPAVALHRLKNELGDEVAIASYHIWGETSDPYYLATGDTIAGWYGVDGIPATACNGSMYMIGGSTGDVDNEYAMYSNVYDYISSTKTPITISVEITPETETAFDVQVNGEVLGELLDEVDLRLHYVITETNIPYHWDPGDLPLDSLFDVVRAILPTFEGVPVTGSEFSDEQHFELDPEWVADNCYLVTFIQDGVNGEVYYAVEQKVFPTKVSESALPKKLALDSSPNPFNAATQVKVALPKSGDINLAVYDIAGNLVKVLADGRFDPGVHSFRWDGRDNSGAVPSGVYFVKLSTEGKTLSRKIVLVK